MTDTSKLADKIDGLRSKTDRIDWHVKQEPHHYPDGTTHFTHVEYRYGDMTVAVASHVTPELGELLCTLHNNLDTIVLALRATQTAPRDPAYET